MQGVQNHKKIIYCDLSPNHSLLSKSEKTKNINDSKETVYAPIMLLTKISPKMSAIIMNYRKFGKNYFCLPFHQIAVFYRLSQK